MSVAAALLVTLLAQAPGPAELVLPGYRLHLVADESVDADTLSALAGSGTVLWLRTRSNMLKNSTVEALARFPEAYVQVRPPLKEEHVRQLHRAPRAGAWLEAQALTGAGLHRLGPRRIAVELRGALDAELARRLAGLRPSRVAWFPGSTEVTLETWGLFAQLPGSKVLAISGSIADVCPDVPRRAALATVMLRVEEGTSQGRCSLGRRVVMRGLPEQAGLVELLSRDPSTELEVEVGPGAAELERARAWVQWLEAAIRGRRQ